MDLDVVATVAKSGEIPIQVLFRRSLKGLTLTVKLLPKVEEFIRGLGSGEVFSVRTMGRHWLPVGGQDLMVYDLNFNPGILPTDAGGAFRLDRPGGVILESEMTPTGHTRDVVNVSFLRLVGASEGSGVTFAVQGVFTDTAVKAMGAQVEAAEKKFFVSYMKPFNLAVMVCTQEIP